jgi:hypothetical protein
MTEPASERTTGLRLAVWKPGFKAKLTALIRDYGFEREYDIPAPLLADYFLICLGSFESLTTQRDAYKRVGWHAAAAPSEEGGRA